MSLKKQALSADEVGRRVAEAAAILEIKPLLDDGKIHAAEYDRFVQQMGLV